MGFLVLCGVTALCRVASSDDLDIQKVGPAWQFTVNGRLALRYHQSPEAAKPFIDPLCTPAGYSVSSARSPQTHHHGLWFTWGGLVTPATGERVDFWAETGDPTVTGEIVPKAGSRCRTRVNDDGASLLTQNEWRRKSDGLVLLTERREVRLLPSGSDRAHLMAIVSEQTAGQDLVISSESNEAVAYYGLALQMPGDMSYGVVVNSRGGEGRAGVEGVGAAWCAYTTDVVPARGVAIFDHPGNPRHPNAWFTLDSGFLSTSLVAHEDYALEAGQTLRLCYGVVAFDGDLDPDLIEQQYDRWRPLSLPSSTSSGACHPRPEYSTALTLSATSPTTGS